MVTLVPFPTTASFMVPDDALLVWLAIAESLREADIRNDVSIV